MAFLPFLPLAFMPLGLSVFFIEAIHNRPQPIRDSHYPAF